MFRMEGMLDDVDAWFDEDEDEDEDGEVGFGYFGYHDRSTRIVEIF